MSAEDDIEVLWVEAVAQYEVKSGTSLQTQKNFRAQNIEDILDLTVRNQNEFGKWRDGDKARKLRAVLKSTLQPIQVLGGVAAQGASAVFSPSPTIFAAVSIFIDAANKQSADYDMVVSVFSDFRDFVGGLNILKGRIPNSQEVRRCIIDILACVLILIGLSTKEMRRGRIVHYFKDLASSNSEVADLNSKLQKALAQLDRLLMRHDIVYSQDTNEKLDQLAIDTSRVMSMMTAPPKADALTRLRNTLDLPPDCEIDRDYDNFSNNLEPDTRERFLRHPQFLKWKNTGCSVLSVLGGPGYGKSFLSTKVIQYLKAHISTSSERSYLTYHYYHASDGFSRSLKGALSTITYQIAKQDSAYAELAASACEKLSTQSAHFETSLWHEIIVKPFRTACRGGLVMIFDGIDEATREGMKRCIDNLRKLLDLQMNVSILFVGRPEMEPVLEPLQDYSVGTIHLSNNLLASDMTRFIDAKYDFYMSKSILKSGVNVN